MLTLPNSEPPAPSFLPSLSGDTSYSLPSGNYCAKPVYTMCPSGTV